MVSKPLGAEGGWFMISECLGWQFKEAKYEEVQNLADKTTRMPKNGKSVDA